VRSAEFHQPARAMWRRSLSAFASACFISGHASGAHVCVSIVRISISTRAYGSRKGKRPECLLDDLIRPQQQRRRDGEAERFGGSHVDG